jgi:hypothetical protein
MTRSITLAVDVNADAAHVFEIISTTEGQRSFWTADCDVTAETARFGFAQAPVDLIAAVTAEPNKVVRMQVTSGFPFWEGSTWEWELSGAHRSDAGTFGAVPPLRLRGRLSRDRPRLHGPDLGTDPGSPGEVRRQRKAAAVLPRSLGLTDTGLADRPWLAA